MKIKTSFVTNSSSSSYLITMESDIVAKVEFVKKLNECLEGIVRKNDLKENFDPQPLVDIDNLIKVSSNVFILEGYVPYFSGYDDLPKHIRDLVLDYNNNPGSYSKFGIKSLKFEIKDNNKPQN